MRWFARARAARLRAAGLPRVLVRGRRLRALGGQAAADRGRVGEGGVVGPRGRRKALPVGRRAADERAREPRPARPSAARPRAPTPAARALRRAADGRRRLGVDRQRLRRLRRLRGVPLSRVLGGVLRRPVQGAARRLVGDAAGRRHRHVPQLGLSRAAPDLRRLPLRRATWRSKREQRPPREHGPEPVQIDVHLRDGALATSPRTCAPACRAAQGAAAQVLLRRARLGAVRADHRRCPSTTRRAPSRRSSTRRRRDRRAGASPRSWSSWARGRPARRTRCSTRWSSAATAARYVPVDVSESAVAECAERLAEQYEASRSTASWATSSRTWTASRHNGDRRLVAFLGGTIGNLDRPARASPGGAARAARPGRPAADRHRPGEGQRAARGRLQRLRRA